MRIVYLTAVFNIKGGSEIYARDLIKELADRGHNLLVVTTSVYELKHENISYLHLPVFGHHALHKFEAPFFFKRVLKAAKKFKPDIIQSHSNSMMGLLGDHLKKKLKVPHILLIELISSQNKSMHAKIVFLTEKFFLPKLNYDKLIVWTDLMKKKFLLPWKIKENKIMVLPAALKLENYDLNHKALWIREKYGNNLLVSMKTLWSTNVEGLKYIVKAMKIVREKHPEWKYIIFGEGKDKKQLVNLVKKLNLEDTVLFGGHIPSFKAKDVLAETDIAPHSFVYEFSTSISLLEYLAMGKPCIVTDVGAVRAVVNDAALIVEPENPKAIANAIIKLIEDKKLRQLLGRKARALFEDKYTIKKSIDSLETLYASLLEQENKGGKIE